MAHLLQSIPFQLVAHLLQSISPLNWLLKCKTQSRLKPLKLECNPQPLNCKFSIKPCSKDATQQSGQGYPSQTLLNHNNGILLGDHFSLQAPAPLPENKLSALLKSIPLSIGGCNTKVELQKGSGCNTKVELQKGSGCNTKVELQKGSGCNTKVELGPKILHCLDVPKVSLHCSGASIVQWGGGGAFINQVPTLSCPVAAVRHTYGSETRLVGICCSFLGQGSLSRSWVSDPARTCDQTRAFIHIQCSAILLDLSGQQANIAELVKLWECTFAT